MSQTEQSKRLIRYWIEELNKGNLGVLDELIVKDYVQHSRHPGTPQGLEGVKKLFAMFAAALPDMHITTEDVIAEGDRIVTRSTVRATHRGPILGVSATGRKVTFGSIDIFRVRGTQFVEHWDEVDRLGLLEQIRD